MPKVRIVLIAEVDGDEISSIEDAASELASKIESENPEVKNSNFEIMF